MIRKQFYVTPEIDRALIILARQDGKTVAEVVREILQKVLKVRQKKEPAGAVLLRMAENAFRGPGDLSTNLFDYLYGNKSPNYGKNAPKLTKAEIKRLDKFLNEKQKNNTR